MRSLRCSVWSAFILVLSLIMGVLAVINGILAYETWWLPYNTEGRYFDMEDGVVYHQGSEWVYATLSLVSGLFCIVLVMSVRGKLSRG